MYYSLTFSGKIISHVLQLGLILQTRQFSAGKYIDTQGNYWAILDWHRQGEFEYLSDCPDDLAMEFIDLVGSKKAFIALQKALN